MSDSLRLLVFYLFAFIFLITSLAQVGHIATGRYLFDVPVHKSALFIQIVFF